MFLWAFAKTLAGSKSYFPTPEADFRPFHVINIVGEYRSIIETFAEEFGVTKDEYSTDDVLAAIGEEYNRQAGRYKRLLIVIDEFGKFLEYAAKHDPEEETYFLQELAEYANDENADLLLIATLHQNFSAYGYDLTKQQQNEWSKVQGRFKEITFNEPVEQLLFLASERLDDQERSRPYAFRKLFKAIKESRSFPLRDYLSEDIAQKLYPLDILSAAILTLALQRYGQNDRSLFSFLESADHMGLQKERRSDYFSIADVYDYLLHSFGVITTKNNPHYVQWASMAASLERVEGICDEDLLDAEALIKTIGLLNTFGSGSMVLDDKFLGHYGKRALKIKDPQVVLNKLVLHRLIRYTKFNRRYVLFDGTDLDIELAIDEAGNLIESIADVTTPLKEYFDFRVVLAKSIYYRKGTPRFFEYVISDNLRNHHITGEIDGIINLVFSESLTISDVQDFAKIQQSPVLYGLYHNTSEIKRLIFEIKKIEKVIETNQSDRVAIRELKNILEHQKRLLNHYVLDNLASDMGSVHWIDFEGKHVIRDEREFNQRLSQLADTVYSQTPVYSSELINKTKTTSAIRSAHRNFLRKLVHESAEPNWGFESHLFPPEKTIFLSLVKAKGMIRQTDEGGLTFTDPTDPSFEFLWNKSLNFIQSSRSGKRSVRELIDDLMQPPLKLKYGFLQFWVPLVLFIRRNDYALYEGDAYIPAISNETLELVLRHPHKYFIKTFQVEGVDLELFKRYRKFLDQRERSPTNDAFIETVRPFLSFYRSLNNYSKKTQRLSGKALTVRDAISKTKDPEALFFRELPLALGTSKQELSADDERVRTYIEELQSVIREIRTSYEELLRRFELYIRDSTGYENAREEFPTRFADLQTSLLSQRQTVFHQRLTSDLEDGPYLSSLAQSLVGKTLDRINDKDESKLYAAFASMLQEMDNVVDISRKVDGESNPHDFILVELQSVGSARKRQVLQLGKVKQKKLKLKKKDVLNILGKDRTVSITVLTELLNDLLDE
ncbi:hypothetical protein LEM8419_02151 [Neolewinella maritima]|uniref:ATP-binding protein n=2 Tax=Neolewinella maritima TaxID=1383882 RepID=A0ABM9B1M3_9BACT|nr:hypothetical protein LEM8419_02151 [Neolewinella maritima]